MISQEKLRKPNQHPKLVIEHIERIIGLDKDIKFETAEKLARNHTALELFNEHKEKKIKKYKDQSIIDPLTGFYTRRYLMGDESEDKQDNIPGGLERRFKEAIRNKTDLTILLVDLDKLKKINDKYGHIIGDEYFKILAKAAKKSFRGTDILVRYGGDEFCFILPNTDAKEASSSIERLFGNYRKFQNESEVLSKTGFKKHLTLSVGVANLNDGSYDKDQYKIFLHNADEALYVAKNLGRDQVIVYGSKEYFQLKKATPLK
jgi:diguanylate cyclase (GGDEF)-like protein